MIRATMDVVSHQLPDHTTAILPFGLAINCGGPVQPFNFQVTGILQLVFSYRGYDLCIFIYVPTRAYTCAGVCIGLRLIGPARPPPIRALCRLRPYGSGFPQSK
ncbi:hypothetical protein FIBSPDRAFT_502390 [Athelia psychrophila]|uniref:Uncharacterized protein n=1 Tax=Athelia psychrophila TaxID=1759441 RepID=A0A166K3W9_9AGAM|nr:hypothetical protein FIBSPDRAFT_502390 [Fibularhizoctonia sp. CBS 109695]